MKKIITLITAVTLLIGCSVKIDSTSGETFKKTLAEIKGKLSKPEQDSLAVCMRVIASKSGHTILELDQIFAEYDGMTADDIFEKGATIIARGVFIKDSTRAAFVTDSTAKYEEQGAWEIMYFVDEVQDKTDQGYLQNIGIGVFSNSAATNRKLKAKFLVTQDGRLQVFLYEYGSSPVKTSSHVAYGIKISQNGNVYTAQGNMSSDRVDIEKYYQKQVIESLKQGGEIKFRLESSPKYGYGSVYLFKMDATNYQKALDKLNN